MTIGALLGRLTAVGVACVGYGFWEARHFVVRRRDVPILPAGSAPLRLLHVSDIHLMARQHYKTDFISALAGLEPDLVVTTGDNWSETDALQPLMRAWGRLRDVPGAFVFGSNDYEEPSFRPPMMYLVRSTAGVVNEKRPLPVQELRAAYSERGWVDVNTSRTLITVRGVTFEFRGTDDAHLRRDDYDLVAGPASPEADVSIGVTHAPYLRVLDAMTTDGVDLILAGHTHGGQVCVPYYGALVTNCDLDTTRAKGLSSYTANGRTSHLHVSAGMGSSPFATYRFACPPEVTVLTLVARDSNG
ncbi:MAG: metallophosphoesterase [Micropruina sp.]|uniref:metallophosphoesterase n=1 Tax=Micropruina sp. TaxID=2737536 RepID=UPI0039E3DB65